MIGQTASIEEPLMPTDYDSDDNAGKSTFSNPIP
jgi:hypothetical protein